MSHYSVYHQYASLFFTADWVA